VKNMLNVLHAVIGRVVAFSYAGFGLAFTYGRRMLFARELSPPYPRKRHPTIT
jgi:hypothetical protein